MLILVSNSYSLWSQFFDRKSNSDNFIQNIAKKQSDFDFHGDRSALK